MCLSSREFVERIAPRGQEDKREQGLMVAVHKGLGADLAEAAVKGLGPRSGNRPGAVRPL